MATVSFRVSESEYVAAHVAVLRSWRWFRWIGWASLAVAVLAACHAIFRLATGEEASTPLNDRALLVGGAFAAYVAYKRRWGAARRARRIYRSGPGAGSELTVAWSADGLQLSDGYTSQSHAWHDVRDWQETSDLLVLSLATGTIAVPSRAVSADEFSDLKAQLSGARR